MKKQLLFTTLFLIIANISFANFSQGNWRWRNNDGNETTATWRAAQNTPIQIATASEVLRLRSEIGIPTFTNGGATLNIQYSLTNDQADVNWTSITTTSNTLPFVIATTNSNLTSGQATTKQLSPSAFPTYVTVPGSVLFNNNNASYTTSGTQNNVSEYEVVILPTNNIVANTTYYIRFGGGNRQLATATLPQLSTATTLPIVLKSLSAKSIIDGVNINWSTASEINNDFFSLQRSVNGLNWEDIAKISGKGTTSNESTYSYLDSKPLKGVNYYRLVQHDLDGKINYSGVTSVKFDIETTQLNAYPNPFTNKLTVSLVGYKGKTFETILTDVQGKSVFQKSLTADQNGLDVMLNEVPKSGMYILSINGNGINFVKKVSVK